ncbi:MAG: GNAT family N-acetyltransferase [Phycisphaerales bacterium]|nr:GNAT family N-acetyltransferase [Phycisphaerales bacterium]
MNLDGSGKPEIETGRLVLNALEMTDCARVASLAGDKRIYEMTLLIPHPYEPHHAEGWISTHPGHWARWREDWTMNFAIRSKVSDELMGAIGLVGVPRHKRAEMGYWLGVPFWGQGFMSEAARAVVGFAFETLGVNRLEAGVFDGNEASAKVLRKAGFVEEGVLRARFLKDGKFVDERMFANLKPASCTS